MARSSPKTKKANWVNKAGKTKKLPDHLGIMIDGNRRWARSRGLPAFEGHRHGIKRVVEISDYAQKKGIKVLTLYGFSTENWERPSEEVKYLMGLFVDYATKYLPKVKKSGVKFQHLGRKDRLSPLLRQKIRLAETLTKNNKKMVLNVALDYGGRDEVARAAQKIAQRKISANKITEQLIMDNLDTKGLPDVDFIIRTSGEMRLSNFLPLQGAYAELYFPKIYWPDFDTRQFDLAMKEFQRRQRRFGK